MQEAKYKKVKRKFRWKHPETEEDKKIRAELKQMTRQEKKQLKKKIYEMNKMDDNDL